MFRKILCLIICGCLVLSLSACTGSGSGSSTASKAAEAAGKYGQLFGGKKITLLCDIGNYIPTLNTEANANSPTVYQSTQHLADEFTKMYPNVTIKWDRTKAGFGDWAQWMTTQIAAGTAPDIVFLQGSTYADKGWFERLNEYLDKPNIFISDNTKWKDTFPAYMWNSYMTSDAKGNIVAIPFTAYPGTATAYYYNKDIFQKVGVSVPKNWEEFISISKKINAAGYIAVAPWLLNKKIVVNNWDIQFSLGPVYADTFRSKWDFNNDSVMTQDELLRAEYEGLFYAENNPAVLDIYSQIKRKYTQVLQKGAQNTDYETLWTNGKVAMMEDGLWRLPTENANTKRKFEFGMFTPPIADTSTSQYAAKIEYTDGPYQPPIETSLNVVKPTVEKKGDGAEETAIRFIQWLTTPKNNSQIVLEKHGESIGVVKGTTIPPELNTWFKQKFPKIPSCQWVTGPTVDSTNTMSRYLEMWVDGYITDQQFKKEYDAALKAGINSQIQAMNIDTSTWKESK